MFAEFLQFVTANFGYTKNIFKVNDFFIILWRA